LRLLDDVSSEHVETRALTTNAFRLLRMVDYLGWQAGRVLDDLWVDDSDRPDPFDHRVASAYLDDVGEFDRTLHEARGRPLAALRERLKQPAEVRLTGPDRLVVTSESRLGLSYRIESGGQVELRTGQAVAWFEAGAGVGLNPPAGPLRRGLVPLGDGVSTPIDVGLGFPPLPPGDGPRPRTTTVTGRASFRGRMLARPTAVERYATPSLRVVHTPPPPGGGIDVTANPGLIRDLGLGGGSVAIVLDASGSMAPDPSRPGTSKIEEARDALRTVLAGLKPGTTFSLWSFGEAVGEDRTTDAERTIRCLQRPTPWDRSLLQPLMDRVSRLVPWNESPILRTMLRARDDLIGASGFKCLLVLTDGMDNRWKEDTQANPTRLGVGQALRAYFDGSDIAVNVIEYGVVDPDERDQVRAQFKEVERFRTPGRYAVAAERRSLIAALEEALRPRLPYRIVRGENLPVPGLPLDLEAGPAGPGMLGVPHPLAAGSYQLWLRPPDGPRRSFAIRDGDRLSVRLTPSPSGVEFERVFYSREAFGLRSAREDPRSGWRLTVPQNQRVGASGVQLLATLERKFDPREATLEVVRPVEAWFEVEPADGDLGRGDATVRVVNLWGYPAPAWGIEVAGWPSVRGGNGPAPPAVRAWWATDREATPAASLDRGRGFGVPGDLSGRTLSIDGETVTIESVVVEEHEVEVGDGVSMSRPCLVVRLAYPTGRPFRARPFGLAFEGSEHRFYEAVGKYTGLFWPVTSEQAEASLDRIALISIAAFRRDADRRGDTLRVAGLGPPDPGDARPIPPSRPTPTPPPPSPPPVPDLEPITRSRSGTRPGR
jgi:hypothetical protein